MIPRLCLAIGLAAATGVMAVPHDAPLRLATYAYPAYDRHAALMPLAGLMKQVSGRPVVVQLFTTPDALAAAMRRGDVDVAVTNLAAFIQLADLPAARPIAVLAPPPATLERYRGVLLVRHDAAASLAGLRSAAARLRYVEVLPGSTSGALVQADALRRAGIDRGTFRVVAQAGTHEAALAELVAGNADVAALAEGPWLAFQAGSPDVAARLRTVWRSAPLPPGPIVCITSAQTPCRRIASALLTNDAASRNAASTLACGWSENAGARRFTRVQPKLYASFLTPSTR